MSITNFTVEYDQLGLQTDSGDMGGDADIVALIGTVTFTAQTSDFKPLLAQDYSPRPAGFALQQPFFGLIDTDGQLKSAKNGSVGVRLPANDPIFDLESLFYRVDFQLTTPLGEHVRVDGGYFEAPSTDTTVNLTNVLTSTGSTIVGVTRAGSYAEDILDSGQTGRAVIRSATSAEALDALEGTQVGQELFTAADAETARAVIQATSESDVIAALAEDETVVAAAAAAVTADIAGRDLVETSDSRLMQNVALFDGWSVTDSIGRQALTVDEAGSTRIYKLDADSIPDESVTDAKFTTTVQNQLMRVLPTESGYAWAVTDEVGRLALAVDTAGMVVGSIPQPAPTDVLVPEISGTTPNRKLWVLNHSSGQRDLVTDSGDPRDAVMSSGAILFTDNTARKCYIPSQGVTRAYPDRTVIACWGDSLTADGGWAAELDTLLTAVTVSNLGNPGYTSDEIAIRQGGYSLTVEVSGGSIPGSGSVSVTSTQSFLANTAVQWSQAGKLAGVSGTLSRAIGDGWDEMTFTRTGSGSPVSVPVDATFISDDALAYENSVVIIQAGRNDANTAPGANFDLPGSVVSAHEAMVDALKPFHKEVLVMGVVSTSDGAGSAIHNKYMNVNGSLKARFGNRFLDLHDYMVNTAIYDLGITPTSGDLAAIAINAVPPSIMNPANMTHYSTAAGAKAALNLIKPKLDSLGWTL